MVSMLRFNDRVEESLVYCEKYVEEFARNDPNRNTLLYDYASCLLQERQLRGT